MTDDDAAVFLEFARSTGDVALFPPCAPSETLVLFTTADEAIRSVRSRSGTHIYLWNRHISPAPTTSAVPEQGLWCIDQLRSDLVEFSVCAQEKDLLRVGRIYVDSYKTVGDEAHHADPQLLRWFDSLARWIRRNYRYDKGRQTYVSPAADDLARQGWRLA